MGTPTRFATTVGWVERINSWKRGRADAAGAIAAPTASQSWSNLDSRGNWVAWNDGTGNQTRVHSGANEIQSIQVGSATTTLQWDGAGNRLADGTSAFAWNIRGLMDTVKRDGAVLGTYGYDALGRRNLKVAGGRRTVFVYDGWQCVWQKVTGSGTDTTKAFVYANYIDEPVNMVRKWGSSTDTLWTMQGNNFNVEALSDRTGAIVERYEYTPYGKVTIFTGAGPDGKWLTADDVVSTTSARGNSLTFQGRELDAETGLYYFRARYYSTWLGRFMSRDPLSFFASGVNIYRMERNNPISWVDPNGLKERTTLDISSAKSSTWRNIFFSSASIEGKLESVECPECSKLKNSWSLEASASGSIGLGAGIGSHRANIGTGHAVLKLISAEIRPVVLRMQGNCDGSVSNNTICSDIIVFFGVDISAQYRGFGASFFEGHSRVVGEACFSAVPGGIQVKLRKGSSAESVKGGGAGYILNVSQDTFEEGVISDWGKFVIPVPGVR